MESRQVLVEAPLCVCIGFRSDGGNRFSHPPTQQVRRRNQSL